MARDEFRGPVDGSSTNRVLLRATSRWFDERGRLFQENQDLFVPAGVTLQSAPAPLDGPLSPGDGQVNTRLEYDAKGRLTFRVEDDGATYGFEYDGADRRIRELLPLVDNVTAGGPHATRVEYTYDANDNVIRQVEFHTSPRGLMAPVRLESTFVYDALNRRVRESDPEGHTRYFEYDSRHNAVASYDARAATMDDPLGLHPQPINARGNAVRYAYDGGNRLWQVTRELSTTGEGGAPLDTANARNPDGLIVIRTEYDANSRIVRRVDDGTNATTYAYDALNRTVAQTNADGGRRTFEYDRDHHRVRLVDENNTLHRFTYDALDRVTRHTLEADPAKRVAGGTLPMLVGTTEQRFEYDGLSRLTRCFDNNDPDDPADDWIVSGQYDSLNRLIEEDQNGRPVGSGFAADDRLTLHYPGAGRVVHFTYDSHDQLIAISNLTLAAVNVDFVGICPPVAMQYSFAGIIEVLRVEQQLDQDRLVKQIDYIRPSGASFGSVQVERNREHDVTRRALVATSFQNQTMGELMDLEFDSASRMTRFARQFASPRSQTNIVV